jgi:hypothetical protein
MDCCGKVLVTGKLIRDKLKKAVALKANKTLRTVFGDMD